MGWFKIGRIACLISFGRIEKGFTSAAAMTAGDRVYLSF
jgi:hypothetical protein